jgi:hypothetical protein
MSARLTTRRPVVCLRPHQPGSTPKKAPTKKTLKTSPAVAREIEKWCEKVTRSGPKSDDVAPIMMKTPVKLASANVVSSTWLVDSDVG